MSRRTIIDKLEYRKPYEKFGIFISDSYWINLHPDIIYLNRIHGRYGQQNCITYDRKTQVYKARLKINKKIFNVFKTYCTLMGSDEK